MALARRLIVGMLALLAAAAPAMAADQLAYRVAIAPTGQGSIDTSMDHVSQLVALDGKAPVGPFALIIRARNDVPRLKTVLDSFGYYDGAILVTIDGHKLDQPTLPELLQAYPKGKTAQIRISARLGPLYRLGAVTLSGDIAPPARAALRLKPGAPAVAANVLAAQTRMETALAAAGHPLAKVAPPVAVLDPQNHTMAVSFVVHAGPIANIGPIRFTGAKRLKISYLRRRLQLASGQRYNPAVIEKARADLAQSGAIASVTIKQADRLDANGSLPLQVAITERPLHAVNLNAAWSTDLGGSAGASWTDRDMFGHAESLALSATATELGGTAAHQPGYNAGAVYTIPDWLRHDQNLSFNLLAVREYLDAYDRTALIVGSAVSRPLTPDITLRIGVQAEEADILQEHVSRDYTLLQLPVTLSYDSAHNLFNPTHGIRASISITPTESLLPPGSFFTIAQASAATYLDVGKWLAGTDGRSILALRGLVGSVDGAGTFAIPPDQRFYAGGSATIRGFRYQSVGPQFADQEPTGGTAIDAASIEYRQRIGTSWGVAIFTDAGQLGSGSAPFQGHVAVGAGVGGRYYTSIGPIRLDVAVPVTRLPGGDSFEIYIGIGQAF